MIILPGRSGQATQGDRPTFTGGVQADPVMPTTDGVTVNNVFFSPGARTFWHSHENGQLIQVHSGTGRVCAAGEQPRVVRPGDIVWAPPGERHWHGAAPDTFVMHLAVSLGATSWAEEVSQADYSRPTAGQEPGSNA